MQCAVINPAAVLTDLTDSAELFHTADSAAYVALMIHGYCEKLAHSVYPISNLVQATILQGCRLPLGAGRSDPGGPSRSPPIAGKL
jgi:hypothetical protein